MNRGARSNFDAKATYLEKMAREGVKPGTYVPRNISQVARWEDRALGLFAWRKDNIHSPNGKYGDIRLRVDAALEIIFPPTQPSLASPSISDKRQLSAIVSQTAILRQEIVRLQEELQTQKSLTTQAEQLVAMIEEENSTLKKALQKIRPLRNINSDR